MSILSEWRPDGRGDIFALPSFLWGVLELRPSAHSSSFTTFCVQSSFSYRLALNLNLCCTLYSLPIPYLYYYYYYCR